MSDKPPPDLAGLAYMFNYVDDPSTYTGLDDKDRAGLEQTYSKDQILGFFDALTWAIAHPNYKFTSLMPPMQSPHFNDAGLLDYFKKLHASMKPLADKLDKLDPPQVP